MGQNSLNIYCSCKPVVDIEYESESYGSPTEVIVKALSEAAEADPIDLPSLYEFVDPDAVNQLLRGYDHPSQMDTLLSFRAETWNVFIRADGRIRVCDNTQVTEPKPVFE